MRDLTDLHIVFSGYGRVEPMYSLCSLLVRSEKAFDQYFI